MKEYRYDGKPQRLSKVIAVYEPLLSYNQIQRLIKDKDVRLNGEKVTADVIVSAGAMIRTYAKDITLQAVYEDENLLIVYKPKGLASDGESSAESIICGANKGYQLCHRLDTNTDGLLMFAKNVEAFDEVLYGFKCKKIEKIYEARVYGKIEANVVYTNYLVKNAKEGKVKILSEQVPFSAEIKTSVRVIGYDGNTTLIEASIFSGKTHQIRSQLAYHGHFILGDSKYGRDEINRKLGYKKQQLCAKKLIFNYERGSFLYYMNSKTVELK